MKKYSWFFKYMVLISYVLIALGCARQHSVQNHGDSLLFSYKDSKAKKITFAHSGDNFNYHSATKLQGNQWQVTIPLLTQFTYFYIVDGEIVLPECPDMVFDDFGGKNCLYVLGM